MSTQRFDPERVAASVQQQERLQKAAFLCGTLMSGNQDSELQSILSSVEDWKMPRRGKLPSDDIGPLEVLIYSDSKEHNLTWRKARDNARKFEFPEGATVTKLRGNPIIVRVDDASGRMVILRREGPKSNRRWRLRQHSGFVALTGRRAGARSYGAGPDQSIER